MRSLAAIFLALCSILAAPVHAQVLSVATYVEEWDPVAQQWLRIQDGAERLVPARARPAASAIAAYGPFRVLDAARAALVDTTDSRSPDQFAAMLRDYPDLTTLEMVECPGTDDDRANMRLGHMIRAAGMITHVPDGGSVRSGAVELFLAGVRRQIDDGAEFAVHSWLDDRGRQPRDFAPDSPENRLYLDYYTEMGMAKADASAFYDMTNSVGFAGAKWLTAQDMRGWLGETENSASAAGNRVIAYLDLGATIP